MNEIDVRLEVSRDGVGEGPDGRLAGLLVGEDGEVGVEEVVRLADRDGEAEPVSGGGDGLGGDAVLSEPRVDCSNAVRGRRYELLDLKSAGSTPYSGYRRRRVDVPPPW